MTKYDMRADGTPEPGGHVDTFLELRKLGCPLEKACNVAGFDKKTYYNWRNEFPEFHAATQRAVQDAIKANLKIIQRAGVGIKDEDGKYVVYPDHRASETLLRYLDPEAFGKNNHLTVKGDLNIQAGIELSDTELADAAMEAANILTKNDSDTKTE